MPITDADIMSYLQPDTSTTGPTLASETGSAVPTQAEQERVWESQIPKPTPQPPTLSQQNQMGEEQIQQFFQPPEVQKETGVGTTIGEFGKGAVAGVRGAVAGEVDTIDWLANKAADLIPGLPRQEIVGKIRDAIKPEDLDKDEETLAYTIGNALGYGGTQMAALMAMFIKPLQAAKLLRLAKVADIPKLATAVGRAAITTGKTAEAAVQGAKAAQIVAKVAKTAGGEVQELGRAAKFISKLGQVPLTTPLGLGLAGGVAGAKYGEREAEAEGTSQLGGALAGGIKHGAMGFAMGESFGLMNSLHRVLRMPAFGTMFGGMTYLEGGGVKRSAADFVTGVLFGAMGPPKGEPLGPQVPEPTTPKGVKTTIGTTGGKQPVTSQGKAITEILQGFTAQDEPVNKWAFFTQKPGESREESIRSRLDLNKPRQAKMPYVDLDVGTIIPDKTGLDILYKGTFKEDPIKFSEFIYDRLQTTGAIQDPTITMYASNAIYEITGGKAGQPYVLPGSSFRGDYMAEPKMELWRLMLNDPKEEMTIVKTDGTREPLTKQFYERMTRDGKSLSTEKGESVPIENIEAVLGQQGIALWEKPIPPREDMLAEQRVLTKAKERLGPAKAARAPGMETDIVAEGAFEKYPAEAKVKGTAIDRLIALFPDVEVKEKIQEAAKTLGVSEKKVAEKLEAITAATDKLLSKRLAGKQILSPEKLQKVLRKQLDSKLIREADMGVVSGKVKPVEEGKPTRPVKEAKEKPPTIGVERDISIDETARALGISEAELLQKISQRAPIPRPESAEVLPTVLEKINGFSKEQAQMIAEHNNISEVMLDNNFGAMDFNIDNQGRLTPLSPEATQFVNKLVRKLGREYPEIPWEDMDLLRRTKVKGVAAEGAKPLVRYWTLDDLADALNLDSTNPRYQRTATGRLSLSNLSPEELRLLPLAKIFQDGLIPERLHGTKADISARLQAIAKENGMKPLTKWQLETGYGWIEMQNEAKGINTELGVPKSTERRPSKVTDKDIEYFYKEDRTEFFNAYRKVADLIYDRALNGELPDSKKVDMVKKLGGVVQDLELKAKQFGFSLANLQERKKLVDRLARWQQLKEETKVNPKLTQEVRDSRINKLDKRIDKVYQERLAPLRREIELRPTLAQEPGTLRPVEITGMEPILGQKVIPIAEARQLEEVVKPLRPEEKEALGKLVTSLDAAYKALSRVKVTEKIDEMPLGEIRLLPGYLEVGTSPTPARGPLLESSLLATLHKAGKKRWVSEEHGFTSGLSNVMGYVVNEDGVRVPIEPGAMVSEYTLKQNRSPFEQASLKEQLREKNLSPEEQRLNLKEQWDLAKQYSDIDTEIELALRSGVSETGESIPISPEMAAMHAVATGDQQLLSDTIAKGVRRTALEKSSPELLKEADRLLGEVSEEKTPRLLPSGAQEHFKVAGAIEGTFSKGRVSLEKFSYTGAKGKEIEVPGKFKVRIYQDALTKKQVGNITEAIKEIDSELTDQRIRPTLYAKHFIPQEQAEADYPWLLSERSPLKLSGRKLPQQEEILLKTGKAGRPTTVVKEKEFPVREHEMGYYISDADVKKQERKDLKIQLRGRAITKATGKYPVLMEGTLLYETVAQGRGKEPKLSWKFRWNPSAFEAGDPREAQAAKLGEILVKDYLKDRSPIPESGITYDFEPIDSPFIEPRKTRVEALKDEYQRKYGVEYTGVPSIEKIAKRPIFKGKGEEILRYEDVPIRLSRSQIREQEKAIERIKKYESSAAVSTGIVEAKKLERAGYIPEFTQFAPLEQQARIFTKGGRAETGKTAQELRAVGMIGEDVENIPRLFDARLNKALDKQMAKLPLEVRSSIAKLQRDMHGEKLPSDPIKSLQVRSEKLLTYKPAIDHLSWSLNEFKDLDAQIKASQDTNITDALLKQYSELNKDVKALVEKVVGRNLEAGEHVTEAENLINRYESSIEQLRDGLTREGKSITPDGRVVDEKSGQTVLGPGDVLTIGNKDYKLKEFQMGGRSIGMKRAEDRIAGEFKDIQSSINERKGPTLDKDGVEAVVRDRLDYVDTGFMDEKTRKALSDMGPMETSKTMMPWTDLASQPTQSRVPDVRELGKIIDREMISKNTQLESLLYKEDGFIKKLERELAQVETKGDPRELLTEHFVRGLNPTDPHMKVAMQMVKDFTEGVADFNEFKKLRIYVQNYFPLIVDMNKTYQKMKYRFFDKYDNYDKLPEVTKAHMDREQYDEVMSVLKNKDYWYQNKDGRYPANKIANTYEKDLLTRRVFGWMGAVDEFNRLPAAVAERLQLKREKFNPHLQHRTEGADFLAYKIDGVDVMKQYIYTMVNANAINNIKKQAAPIVNKWPEPRAMGSVRWFMEKQLKTAFGTYSPGEIGLTKLADWINQSTRRQILNPNYLSKELPGKLVGGTAKGVLGVDTAIRNLTQQVQLLVDKGPTAYMKAVSEYLRHGLGEHEQYWDALRIDKQSFGATFEETGIERPLRERLAYQKGLGKKALEFYDWMGDMALGPMRATEHVNKAIGFILSLQESKAKGLDFEKGIRIGLKTISRQVPDMVIPQVYYKAYMDMLSSQYGYTTPHRSPLLRGPLARVSTIFWSYPANTIQFVTKGLKESWHAEDYMRFSRFLGYVGFQLAAASGFALLGLDVANIWGVGILPVKPLSLPWEVLYNAYKGINAPTEDDRAKARDNVVNAMGSLFIPQYRYGKKVLKGIKNLQDGYRTAGPDELATVESTPLTEMLDFMGFPPIESRETWELVTRMNDMTKVQTRQKQDLTLRGVKALESGDRLGVLGIMEQAKKKGIPLSYNDIYTGKAERENMTLLDRRLKSVPKNLKPQVQAEIDALKQRAFPGQVGRKFQRSRNMWSNVEVGYTTPEEE